MQRLEGKTAVIAGGAGGQGAAAARLFVEEGANVVVGDIDDGRAAQVCDELGENARSVRLDVTMEVAWTAAIETAERTFGGVDILVCCAGITPPLRLIADTSLGDFRRVVEVNQMGTFLGIRAAIPAMDRSGGGSIVIVASTAGVHGVAGLAPYTCSKFGLRGLARVAALELANQGIRVNAVLPGPIDTAMIQPGSTYGEHDLRPIMAKGVPLGRIGQPEEVARLLCWLASDESSFCTGADFTVDGGVLAGQRMRP